MLLRRNGANKTNLIANKLHGEFSYIFSFRASEGGKKTGKERKRHTCGDTPNAAYATPEGLIGFDI